MADGTVSVKCPRCGDWMRVHELLTAHGLTDSPCRARPGRIQPTEFERRTEAAANG